MNTLRSYFENVPRERRNELVAGLLTLLLCVVVALVVGHWTLSYSHSAQQTWPPADSPELLFEGEYVMTGDVTEPEVQTPEPAEAGAVEEPAVEGLDRVDEGDVAETPAPPVVSERPSPMQVAKPKPVEKPGPSKAEIEAQKAREKAREETQQKIAGQMKFGSNSSSGNSSGKSGTAAGSASSGSLSGAPGYTLSGRSLAYWEMPVKTAANGTVKVRVVVNQQGKVIEASVASSSGAAASDQVRQACVEAAKKSQFSVSLDSPARQSGVITYKFVAK